MQVRLVDKNVTPIPGKVYRDEPLQGHSPYRERKKRNNPSGVAGQLNYERNASKMRLNIPDSLRLNKFCAKKFDAYCLTVKWFLRLNSSHYVKQEDWLGELIKAEQEAGRLAISGRPNKGNNDVTFMADYGLTKIESSRAQELAEHKDIIAMELWIAREKLSYSPSEAASKMHGANIPRMTWASYCKSIGLSKAEV